MSDQEARTVMVTGASTGIGRATVAELINAGFVVWATVRRDEDAAELQAVHGDRVRPVLMDLLDHESVREVGARIRAEGPLHGLVNNAGAALPGPLEYLPIEVFRRQLDINLTGQLLVTQELLPALRQAAERNGDARIVLIGSIGGRIAGPILGAYHAAKHGLAGLSDALRAELAPDKIQVILIEPGSIATPIWKRGSAAGDEAMAQLPAEGQRRYAKQLERVKAQARRGESTLSPTVPAATIREALTAPHPKPRQVVGRDAQVAAAMVRLLPFRVLYRLTAARR